jgi:hypothetical protein
MKYSRDKFTKSLLRIADRIDKQQEYRIGWNDTILRGKQVSTVLVNNLWAVGSWARGALECGDLDLVLEVTKTEGHFLPSESSIRREVIGNSRYVRTYIGTPQKNSSGATFDEAVLIWSKTSRDWKSNIRSIQSNPNATRYHRKHDELPLRPEQMQGYDLSILEKLVDLKNEGRLAWDWIAMNAITPKPEQWSKQAKSINDLIARKCGIQTKLVMPFVIQWFEDFHRIEVWKSEYNSPVFRINGAAVIVGRPSIPISTLEGLSCSALILVPHLSKRGPNGLWVIRRCEKHRLVESFRNMGAYVIYDKGEAQIYTEVGDHFSDNIKVVWIFRSRDLAQEELKVCLADLDDSGIEEPGLDIRYCTGSDLLNLLSKVDKVEIDYEPYAITTDGKRFDERVNEIEVTMLDSNNCEGILSGT